MACRHANLLSSFMRKTAELVANCINAAQICFSVCRSNYSPMAPDRRLAPMCAQVDFETAHRETDLRCVDTIGNLTRRLAHKTGTNSGMAATPSVDFSRIPGTYYEPSLCGF